MYMFVDNNNIAGNFKLKISLFLEISCSIFYCNSFRPTCSVCNLVWSKYILVHVSIHLVVDFMATLYMYVYFLCMKMCTCNSDYHLTELRTASLLKTLSNRCCYIDQDRREYPERLGKLLR